MAETAEHPNHPFGFEKDFSIKHLFRFFANNVYLGQWELARACVADLHVQAKLLGKDIHDFIGQLAGNPFNASLGLASVNSPQHLSWLCLTELESRRTGTGGGHHQLKKDLEFQLLLLQAGRGVSKDILKELYSYQKEQRQPEIVQPVPPFGSDSLNYLKDILYSEPALGHSIISNLTFRHKRHDWNNEQLQRVYLKCMEDILQKLQEMKQHSGAGECHAMEEKLYSLLALFNPKSEMKRLGLNDFLTKLVLQVDTVDLPLHKSAIYSSLLVRDDPFLIDAYCDIENKVMTKKFTEKHSSESETKSDCIEDDSKQLYAAAVCQDRENAWQQLYFRCLKQEKHFIDSFVEAALQMVKIGQFDRLQRLFVAQELKVLKPVVLLMGWKFCHSATSARSLLTALWKEEDDDIPSALQQACKRLSYQVDLVQWCLDKASPLMKALGTSTAPQENLKDMFQSLETHSVLYMLHHATQLSQLEEQEVMDIIQKSPILDYQGKEVAGPLKREKTVRFNLGDADVEKTNCPPSSMEHMRDIAVYRSYCVIRSFMDAIAAGANSYLKIDHLSKQIPLFSSLSSEENSAEYQTESQEAREKISTPRPVLKSQRSLNPKWPLNKGPDAQAQSCDLQNQYSEHVMKNLNHGRDLLSNIHPLTYRVEIIENVFSLLFVTHEHMAEVCSDSGEELLDIGSTNTTMDWRDVSTISEEQSFLMFASGEHKQEQIVLSDAPDQAIEALELQSQINYDAGYDVPFEDSANPKASMVKTEGILEKSRLALFKPRLISHDKNFDQKKQVHTSGNTSAFSSSSSTTSPKLGFLMNDYLVRDILAILKDCMVDLKAAKFAIQGQGLWQYGGHGTSQRHPGRSEPIESAVTKELEVEMCKWVKSSVNGDLLQKHITRLDQYISEAQWRYQMVSSAAIPTVVGQIASGVTQVEDSDSSDDLDGARDLAEEEEEDQFKKRQSRVKRNKRDSAASGKESSRSGLESGDILDDGNTSGPGRPRRYVKRKRVKSFGKGSFSQVRRDKSIVTKMLSSHDALLVMSLRRGNYSQAQQVIKLFNLQGEAAASEVVFAQQYEGALTKLQSFQSQGSETFSKPISSVRQGLGAVRKAAEAGVAKMTISSIVDQLLLSQNLPQFSQDLLQAVKSQGPSSLLTSHLKSEDIPWMIMLDLACCGCKSWETCNSMLTMANNRLKGEDNKTRALQSSDLSKDSSRSSKNDISLKGMAGFLEQLTKLHTQSTSEGSQVKADFTNMFVKQSANQCLISATLPLDLTSFQLYFSAVIDLDKGLESVEKALENAVRLERKAASSGKQKVKLKPLTHNSMKALLTHHKQLVPVAGLQAYLLRNQTTSKSTNYLFTLYNHVKQLAFLVAECESMETVDPRGNYFKMLQEGPTQILGKLMFGKKMPPTRLEVVAKKMKLNLTRVIVKNCCPNIPSRYPYDTDDALGPVLQNGKLILNACDVCPLEVRHPEIIARELLTRMIKLMKEQATQATGSHVFNITAAKSIIKTAEYREITRESKELKWVDLSLLDAKNEKRCFFVNLLNLMYILVYLYEVEKQMREEGNGRPRGASFGNATEHKGVSDIVVIPTSVFEQISFHCKMCFHVGQLGPVSLFDLHYVICHQGLNAPTKMDKLISDRVQALDHSDPWYKYSPPPDPRLIFVISEGCQSSPPLQVLTPDLASNQLKAAMTDYFIHNIEAKEEEKMVVIPQLLVWYRQNFASDGSSSFKAEYEGLLQFIANFATGGLYEKLRALLETEEIEVAKKEPSGTGTKNELPFKVLEEVFDYTFCYTFEFAEKSYRRFDFSSLPKRRRHSSLPPELESSSGSMTSSTPGFLKQSEFDRAAFRLTPVTLEYLKSSSSLVATLVSLVCADEMDDIEQHIQEDFFASNRSDTDIDLNVVDIKSYRYQKLTTEFSVLHRHILAHIEPIIAARNPEIRHGGDPLLKFSSDSYNSSIKACILALQEGQQFRSLVSNVLNEVLSEKNWDVLLEVLGCIPVVNLLRDPDLLHFKDYILCCAAKEQGGGRPPSPSMVSIGSAANISLGGVSTKSVITEKWHYLQQISRPDTQAREVMCSLRKWNVNDCVTLLEQCAARDIENTELLEALKNKLQDLKVYQRITEHAKNKQIKSSMRPRVDSFSNMLELDFDKLEELGSWTVVATLSDSEPEPIFRLLVTSQDFQTARAWSNMHNVGETMKKEIEESHITFLLEQDSGNMSKALQALEELKQESVKFCFSICQSLLEKLVQQQHKLFLADFLLNDLPGELGQREKDELLVTCMGAKALLCLPEHARSEYDHLSSSPNLLLEQLLMNMKVDWASKAYESMLIDYNHLADKSLGCSVESFNELIAEYARKALEFPVVQVEDRSRSDSATSMSTVNLSDTSILHNTSFTDMTFRRFPRTPSLASVLSRSPSDSPSAVPTSGSFGAKEGTELITSYYSSSGQFLLPAEPPSKDKWVPDMAVTVCMVCKLERFSMFVRRHHCRRCGRVVCYACSARTTLINGTMARTCDDCFEAVMSHKENSEKEMLQQRLRDRLSGSVGRMSSSPARVSLLARTPENVIEEEDEEIGDMNKTDGLQAEFFWRLTQEQIHNKTIREDFYYEYAPSLPLCLSILALHSDSKECGQLLLSLCDNVSKLLAVKNDAEVDYGLVISMMKYLLFNAKMKFLSCGNSYGIDQCEMYSGRVEMLNLLVASHCKHIPSLIKLTQLETVRRLRDKLIEDERLTLAMEISTKCGLDPAGVWAAWGKACLKTGDFYAAREKFSRCMKAPVDKNQNQQSSNMLNDIVECIENLPGSGINTIQALQASLKSISSLIAEPFVVQNEETNISEQQLQECLYYLKAYGTYGSVISFYRKHGYWMKAVQYLLDKKCSPDVFVECLLVPSLKAGELTKLQDQLILIDTTLEKWAPYLKAACRYLNKKKHMQVLYQLQLFMKDYVRAAMTCITHSFQHGAESYVDLYNRLSYMRDAKQHLEDYLEQKLWLVGQKGSVGRRVPDWTGSGGETLRLLQPPKEVNRYINTISLQVEATKFLHQTYTAGASAGELMFPPGKLPTLFGNNNVKVDVVSMVMLSGKNVNDGFGIAYRIIQEFHLNATLVYTTVARQLSKQKKYISVKQLLGCIQESGLCDDQSYDEVIGACVRVMADDATEAKEAESLIKLIKSQANKINAYILCGKLKSAYLIAVKEERVEDVQRISGAALRAGQPAVKNICDKWLHQRQKTKR